MIGGLVAFAWSSLSWMVLPFHEKSLTILADPAPLLAALAPQAEKSGVYLAPNHPGGMETPFLFVAYSKEGWGGMGLTMLAALALYGFGGFWWTWVLGKIPGLTALDSARYGAMFGLALGALGSMPYSVWWKFPFGFSFLYLIDHVVIWSIASPLIARWGQASVCALPK